MPALNATIARRRPRVVGAIAAAAALIAAAVVVPATLLGRSRSRLKARTAPRRSVSRRESVFAADGVLKAKRYGLVRVEM